MSLKRPNTALYDTAVSLIFNTIYLYYSTSPTIEWCLMRGYIYIFTIEIPVLWSGMRGGLFKGLPSEMSKRGPTLPHIQAVESVISALIYCKRLFTLQTCVHSCMQMGNLFQMIGKRTKYKFFIIYLFQGKKLFSLLSMAFF